jgi:hypothetical protein
MSSRSVGRRGRRLGLVALTLASAACGSLGRGSGQPATTLIFSNESLDQAAVYVVAPGAEFRRIGTVIPGRTETLTIPADMAARAGSLNIVARLLARNELPQTGPVTIRPGDRYQVRLTPDAKVLSFLPAPS